ncbi:MAG TPA: cytochrome c oxidase subunit 3 [Terriglobia bacterium]|nr:cytochrome c oxidase subunit 3 [Terriglobia bacterium]
MASSLLTPTQEKEVKDTGGFGNGSDDDGFGGGGDGWNSEGAIPASVSLTGVWVAILAIVMFFAALTSVWIILKGSSHNWVPTALPRIVYVNSVVLLVSSLTLEFSRGSLTAGLPHRFLVWIYVTLGLGIAFIAGQLIAWKQLVGQGIYLATNPSSSFFYLLTAAHGLHLLGGIFALALVALHGPGIAKGVKSRSLLDGTALYWHFMYGLWIYILLLLVLDV